MTHDSQYLNENVPGSSDWDAWKPFILGLIFLGIVIGMCFIG